ncbi:hypothetical protein ACDL92_00895 [Ihubacter sp. mB4P-1]|uniref:hypothetical protein n=1 Tax=Ihubacter sp. mB4P-1 TaxID=3242370 RepID=UPI003C7E2C21
MIDNNIYETVRKYAEMLISKPYYNVYRILIREGRHIWSTKDNADFHRLLPEGIFCAADSDQEKDPLLEFFADEESFDIGALILSVTPYCARIGRSRKVLTASLDDMAQIIGWQARQAENSAASIKQALKDAAACFVGEASVVTGRNLYEATVALDVLEKSAEVAVRAEALGGAEPLAEKEARYMRMHYIEKYSKAEQAFRSGGGQTNA